MTAIRSIGVIGAGAWGTALAQTARLAGRVADHRAAPCRCSRPGGCCCLSSGAPVRGRSTAFAVIGLLGIKLFLALIAEFNKPFKDVLENETTDAIVSVLTVLIFAVPIATSYLFDMPKRHR